MLCYQWHTMVSHHLWRKCSNALAMMVGCCVISGTLWSLIIYEENAVMLWPWWWDAVLSVAHYGLSSSMKKTQSDALFGDDGGTLSYHQCHTMVSRHLWRKCSNALAIGMGHYVTSVTLSHHVLFCHPPRPPPPTPTPTLHAHPNMQSHTLFGDGGGTLCNLCHTVTPWSFLVTLSHHGLFWSHCHTKVFSGHTVTPWSFLVTLSHQGLFCHPHRLFPPCPPTPTPGPPRCRTMLCLATVVGHYVRVSHCHTNGEPVWPSGKALGW